MDSVPTDELVELVLGNYPPLDNPRPIYQQPIAICSQLEPLPDTPPFPPVHERGQSFSPWTGPWDEEQFQYQSENQHKRGVAVSTSGICGNPNQIYQGDCAVCGTFFDTIKEEITFDYLERTHMTDETYLARLRRRKAFQAGMAAGSFVLVPGGVSMTDCAQRYAPSPRSIATIGCVDHQSTISTTFINN